MKKSALTLLSAAAIVTVFLQSEAKAGPTPDPVPVSLQLTEETRLYAEPNTEFPLAASLSPQTVAVKQRFGMSNPYTWDESKWYQIETWLGPQWIYAAHAIPGHPISNAAADHYAIETSSLYDLPFRDKATSFGIAPQAVRVLAESGYYTKIATWIGEKWIPSLSIVSAQKIEPKKLVLPAETLLFEVPSEKSRIIRTSAEQTLTAIGMMRGWYQLQTPEGVRWYNPKIGPSPLIVPSNEVLELDYTAFVGRWPHFDTETIAVLAPQTVRAFERRGDYVHIHTYAGDGWVRMPDPFYGIRPRGFGFVEAGLSEVLPEGTKTTVSGKLKVFDNHVSLQNDFSLDLVFYRDEDIVGKIHLEVTDLDYGDPWAFTRTVDGDLSGYTFVDIANVEMRR